MSFPKSVEDQALAACARRCCICQKFCGRKMELHHIKQRVYDGEDSFENCIPLCFDCHADMGKADPKHPKGKHYSENELRLHRDNWYAKVAKMAYWVSFILMALVLTPLGVEAYGARRWIQLPFNQTLQPSEVTKLAIVIFIPLLICKAGKRIKDWKVFGAIFLWGAIAAAGVFFLTDNLSTAVIVMGMVCIMLFVAHPKTAPFIAVAAGGIALIAVVVKALDAIMDTSSDFRLRRILVWLHPEEYASDGGYQVMQGLYAIGSGGFWGKGLGNSAQKMIIPEAQNDMILSIICEELGVFGVIVMLTLFGMLLYRLMFIAQNAPDLYGSLIVTGIFAHIAIQVILNIAVVLNLIPTTGITLPFISYGGTSILFLMAEMGLALGVSRKIQFEE